MRIARATFKERRGIVNRDWVRPSFAIVITRDEQRMIADAAFTQRSGIPCRPKAAFRGAFDAGNALPHPQTRPILWAWIDLDHRWCASGDTKGIWRQHGRALVISGGQSRQWSEQKGCEEKQMRFHVE